jgi:3-hydroxybutyryl-CoA dehydrogenase
MASGIAYAVAAAGQRAVVLGRSIAATASARGAVARALGAAAERDRLGGQSAEEILERIDTTTDLSELEACDLVIEAVTEDLTIKWSVFSQLDQALPEAELLATNTSSLQVRDIAEAVDRPDRVGALHFFSPVPAMKLVEVVGHESVPDVLLDRAAAWARSIGKVSVRCADRAGFIVNSLLIPFLNDTVRAGAEGAGTPAELDRILVAEAGHPMGPFQLLDFIGLDVSLTAQRALFAAEPGNERLRPADALVQHVEAGRLGRKSGRGFYDYESTPVTT